MLAAMWSTSPLQIGAGPPTALRPHTNSFKSWENSRGFREQAPGSQVIG